MKLRSVLVCLVILVSLALPLFANVETYYKDPMLMAVYQGDVKYITAHKADINKRYPEMMGGSALFVFRFGTVPDASISTLLKLGALVDFEDENKRTPLFWAAFTQAAELVRTLITAGADVNHQDIYTMTALSAPAQINASPIAKILLDAGANAAYVDQYGKSAMDYSRESKYFVDSAPAFQALLKQYLPKGSNSPAAKPRPPTPTPSVTAETKAMILRKLALLTPGQNVVKPTPSVKPVQPVATPESEAVRLSNAVAGNDGDFVASFTGDINQALDANGTTALMVASNAENADMVDALLAAKAKVNQKMKTGFSALMLAVAKGNMAILDTLIAAGADVNAKITQGQSVLMIAVNLGQPGVIQALIEAGADVNARDPKGLTALMYAAAKGQYAPVKVLLAAGAKATTVAADGSTALDYAKDSRIYQLIATGED